MKRSKIIWIIIILLIFSVFYLFFNSKNNVKFKLDTDKKNVSSIIIKSSKDNEAKYISNKNEINKIINYLNSLDYVEQTSNIKTEYDYFIKIVKKQNNSATYLEISDEYIMVRGIFYKSSSKIISDIEKIYESLKD